MICKNCGAENPEGEAVCGDCGEEIGQKRRLYLKMPNFLEIFIGTFILLVVIVSIIPSGFDDHTRSPVARVKGDQRTMTIALETYYLDLNNYPAWSLRREENANGGLQDKKGELALIPTFRIPNGSNLATLTTPIGYLPCYWADPYAPLKGATYGYWNDGTKDTTATGYIIWSAGPDRVYDLTIDNIAQAYNPQSAAISPLLLNCTYDPSNGTGSRGDLYRTKM